MYNLARWGTLALSIAMLVGWVSVSVLRARIEPPPIWEMEPGWVSYPTGPEATEMIENTRRLCLRMRRTDLSLRILASVAIAAHLIVLNWRRP